NKMDGGAGAGKGRKSGAIQISRATSNETTVAETHRLNQGVGPWVLQQHLASRLSSQRTLRLSVWLFYSSRITAFASVPSALFSRQHSTTVPATCFSSPSYKLFAETTEEAHNGNPSLKRCRYFSRQ